MSRKISLHFSEENDEESSHSLRKRYGRGRPGSRRYNRWYNGFVLGQDFGEPVTADFSPEDLAELFKRESRPVFVFEDPREQERWETFCAQPEEVQREQTSSALCAHRRRIVDMHRPRTLSAVHAYARINRRCRPHLAKYAHTPLLSEMDLAVRSLLPVATTGTAEPTTSSTSSSAVLPPTLPIVTTANGEQATRAFTLPNAFHRLLLHGVCAYYGVLSRTSECVEVRAHLHPTLPLHTPATPLLEFLGALATQRQRRCARG
jgi:R3H-associated N-terminal domain